TGVVYFIPNQQQVAIICVRVEAWDTTVTPRVMTGSVKRDIQVVITAACNNPNLAFGPPPGTHHLVLGTASGPNPYNCGDNTFVLPLSAAIQCGSVVPSDIRVLRSFGFPNPVTNVTPINCSVGITDSLLVTLLYPLTQGSNQVII